MGKKVLFINPLGKCIREFPPLNISMLMSYLNEKKVETECLDLSLNFWYKIKNDKKFLEKIYTQLYILIEKTSKKNIRKKLFLYYLNKKFKEIKKHLDSEKINYDLLYFYYLFSNIPQRAYNSPKDTFLSLNAKKILPLGLINDHDFGFNIIKILSKEIESMIDEKLKSSSIICLSATYSQQLEFSLHIAKYIKKQKKSIKIIIGGSWINYLANNPALKKSLFKDIDYAITDECESSLFKLIKSLRNKKSIADIPNLTYFIDNKMIINKKSYISNLNKLPPPNYRLFHSNMEEVKNSKELSYEIGRGCYWNKCSFCNPYRRKFRYREKSAKKIIEDLKFINQTTGINRFILITDVLSPKRAEGIAKELIKQNLNFEWASWMRLEKKLDKLLLQKLKKSGCYRLSFGLESGCQKINDYLKKGVNLKIAERIIRQAKKIGINCRLFVILGIPNESPYQTFLTFKFFNRNKNFTEIIDFHKFKLDFQSDMYKNSKDYGILKINPTSKRYSIKFKRYNFYNKHVINWIIKFYNFYFNKSEDITYSFPKK